MEAAETWHYHSHLRNTVIACRPFLHFPKHENTGVNNSSNNGSIQQCPSRQCQWVGMHYTRALHLATINGMQPPLMLLIPPVYFLLWYLFILLFLLYFSFLWTSFFFIWSIYSRNFSGTFLRIFHHSFRYTPNWCFVTAPSLWSFPPFLPPLALASLT